ncbi:MAG: tetratricopeptide repeat protein [Nitrospinales bacterium]
MNRAPLIAKGAALAAAVFAAYYPSFHAGFIWDDDTFFTRNPLMTAPDALRRFWMTAEAPDYFPLVSTVLWVQRQLWGLDPLGYHLVNIGFHALNGVLFWRILERLAVPWAWWAGLAYALHPVQVESVAWATQIKNVQSTFFYLLAICFYLRHEARLKLRDYFLSWFLFLLALLSKTSVVMLPVILVLFHWWKGGLSVGAVLRRTAPFFFLSGILAATTLWFQYHNAGARGPEWSLGFLERLVNAGHSAGFYLLKLFAPINLTFVYPRWSFDPSHWTAWLPHLGWTILGVLLFMKRHSWGRPAIFGLGYFLISLFPVLGFFNIYFMLYSFVADHWQYVASQGIIALTVAGLSRGHEALFGGRVGKTCAAVGMGLVVVALAFLTWNQQAIYQNNVVLWQDTLTKNPRAWIAHNSLGNEWELANNLEQAVGHYRQVLRIKPDYAPAEDNLGLALLKLGRAEESESHFRNAIRLDPSLWQAHNNLGMVLARRGRMDEAVRHFEEALKLNPDDAGAHNNLGLILDGYGRYREALEHFRLALSDPANRHQVHNNIGALLYDLGRVEEAAAYFRKALEIKPDFDPARMNLERAEKSQAKAD